MALSRKSFGHSRLKRPKEKSQPTQKKKTLDAGQNTSGVQTNWADSVFFKSVATSIPVPKIAACVRYIHSQTIPNVPQKAETAIITASG